MAQGPAFVEIISPDGLRIAPEWRTATLHADFIPGPLQWRLRDTPQRRHWRLTYPDQRASYLRLASWAS